MDYKASRMVLDYVIDHIEDSDNEPDVVVEVVAKFSVLHNLKYLLKTNLHDGKRYMVTYNNETNVWYLDVYQRVDKEAKKGGDAYEIA